MSCSRFVVTLVVLSLLVGIGGMICGAYASYWYTASFTSTSDVNTGLWKMCKNIKGNKDCTTREAIFKFTTDHKFMFQVTTQSKYRQSTIKSIYLRNSIQEIFGYPGEIPFTHTLDASWFLFYHSLRGRTRL